MDSIIRIKMVKAMEFIARQINDEEIFESWLYGGVADGDIDYADLSVNAETENDDFKYYISDKEFSDMMNLFVRLMARARKSGGLWCDKVCSEREEE